MAEITRSSSVGVDYENESAVAAPPGSPLVTDSICIENSSTGNSLSASADEILQLLSSQLVKEDGERGQNSSDERLSENHDHGSLGEGGNLASNCKFAANIVDFEQEISIERVEPSTSENRSSNLAVGNEAAGLSSSSKTDISLKTREQLSRDWIQVQAEGKDMSVLLSNPYVLPKIPRELREGEDGLACGIGDTSVNNCMALQAENDMADKQISNTQEESLIKAVMSEPTEWISVEVPNLVDDPLPSTSAAEPANPVCSTPCSLVEWITVEMPSRSRHASLANNHDAASSTQDEMCVSEHVCVTFSEMDGNVRHTVAQKSSASSQDSATTPVPRTRKRRTISGKIRARIEAFENSFRQELDRLNSPLTKPKNRRVHEGLRRSAVAAAAIEEGRVAELKTLQQEIKHLMLADEKIMSKGDTLFRKHSEEEGSWLAVVENRKCSEGELDCDSWMKALREARKPNKAGATQEEERRQCRSELAAETESKVVSETTMSCTREETSEESIKKSRECQADDNEESKTLVVDEEDEWELAGKGVPSASFDKSIESSQLKEGELEETLQTEGDVKGVECEYKHLQAPGGVGVGGLMKQVISGAALLAGLIFLWPRGNNLIWRAPQKRQRSYMVNRSSPKNIPPRKRDDTNSSFHGLNLERFKG